MAPVIEALRKEPWACCRVLATAQHRDMLDQVLQIFHVTPDLDLDIMRKNQSLTELTARLLPKCEAALEQEQPDAVLAQGDTTTVLVMALVAFYKNIPFGHVEAGLRTRDMRNPFPEEMNRVLASALTRWHFAPTESAKANLLAEGVPEQRIHVTGNPVIDALLATVKADGAPAPGAQSGYRMILLTAHRRENFGEPMREVFAAVRELVDLYEDVRVVYPVHPNPNVQKAAHELLGMHERIDLVDPLGYLAFVKAMQAAYFILSDSGGVQEEAPALGKPVLVLRSETERPEAVSAGVVKLVGPNRERILAESKSLLDDPAAYRAMARGVSPYGDGQAASRIAAILRADLSPQTDRTPAPV